MKIQGLQKTTLLDYPGHVAATIFLGGCNFRCPFCHNMNIVDECNSSISEEEILSFLQRRSGVLEGVCITGGEPTLNKELIELVRKIKNISVDKPLLVKLDTNGTNPEVIKNLIDNNLVNYIAMDIKSSEEGYFKTIGLDDIPKNEQIITNIKKSIELIMKSGIEYEFRTTIVKNYHNEETINGIGMLIKGANKHYIQSFVDSEYVKDHSLSACDRDELNSYLSIIKKYVKEASIRGVD